MNLRSMIILVFVLYSSFFSAIAQDTTKYKEKELTLKFGGFASEMYRNVGITGAGIVLATNFSEKIEMSIEVGYQRFKGRYFCDSVGWNYVYNYCIVSNNKREEIGYFVVTPSLNYLFFSKKNLSLRATLGSRILFFDKENSIIDNSIGEYSQFYQEFVHMGIIVGMQITKKNLLRSKLSLTPVFYERVYFTPGISLFLISKI